MENIRKWFENDFNEECEIIKYDGHLEARTKSAIFMVVAPHSGTNNRWMLRISTKAAFDRWINSTAIEEFFESDVELCDYLNKYLIDIYKRLVEYLSEEYSDMEKTFVEYE